MMKTIRGKLLVYFFVFLIMFQLVAVSIYISSNKMTSTYEDNFQRFLLLNTISQRADDLYVFAKDFASKSEPEQVIEFQRMKKDLMKEEDKLVETVFDNRRIEARDYINTLDTFLHEAELTVGFVLLDDIEQYTYHLEETGKASRYIREATLELLDAELTLYQPRYQELAKRNEYFLIFIIFLFLTTTMLAAYFALWFSRGITEPIQNLSYAAKEVARGDLKGQPVTIQSSDELKLLGDTFNQMRMNIDQLVTEIKDQSELDQLLKDMEIKQLQNQINPHFLFNTLNTMSKMAYLEDAKATSELIESVATILRNSLGEIDKSVTLNEELDVVKGYFQIQKTRFAERINFHIYADAACLGQPIPRLTLQPLVENAFIHGIEEREEGGEISISIRDDYTHVIVEVKDDGNGMRSTLVEEIMSMTVREAEHIGHSTGIGVTNVIRRLQLFYKVEDVMTIDSEIGKGTTVRLHLPKTVKRDEVDANRNSGR